jgi:ParB-like chromosome segregation protein Spo0J
MEQVVKGNLKGFKNYPPEWTELSTLVEDTDNANFHTDADLVPTGNSLAAFGQVETLCADKISRRVIGGNGRLRKLREQGVTHAWVTFVEGTEDQLRSLAIALNQTGRNSDFDFAVLTRQIQDLEQKDHQLVALTALPEHLLSPLLAAEHLMPVVSADIEEDGGIPPVPASSSGKSEALAARGLTIAFTREQRDKIEEALATAEAEGREACDGPREFLFSLVEEFLAAGEDHTAEEE